MKHLVIFISFFVGIMMGSCITKWRMDTITKQSLNQDSMNDVIVNEYYRRQGIVPDTIRVAYIVSDTTQIPKKRMVGYIVYNSGSGPIYLDGLYNKLNPKYAIWNYWNLGK